MKELRNMKTLRYLLIVIGVLSVVSVAAATFGTTYQPQRRGIQYSQHYAEMPTLTMSSTGSVMMKSGSALPMAAVSGITTADDYAPSGPRRAKRDVGEGGTTEDGDEDPDNPGEPMPLGDVLWPLMLMALAFCGVVYLRRKKRTLNG
jgi:hypothetical protein